LGKSRSREVIEFKSNYPEHLGTLRRDILDGSVVVGDMRRFQIYDPKHRTIHAPCFRERVLDHALMNHAEPVLDRALVADTYACRVGKGALAAVLRAQQHLRCWRWYGKANIRSYFASIDHTILLELLMRRFKNQGLLALMGRIIQSHHSSPGKGLPIGALTSQQFANYYLSGLDRHLLETCGVGGFVRYMDDLVWWGDSREFVRIVWDSASDYASERLGLEIKQPQQIDRSEQGLSFCGYRIFPGRLLLSRRRKRHYIEYRNKWEVAYRKGSINSLGLQAGYASALAITVHADAASWRREQLQRNPLDESIAAL
ncbi:MAG: RNA-directed DNA polymerase, partial [Chakrabartia sp.]